MRRKRYSKRKLMLGAGALALAVVLLGTALFWTENRMKQSEGKGDSGQWGSGDSGKFVLSVDGLDYSYTDDVDSYLIIGTDGNEDSPGSEEGFNGSMADFITVLIINRTRNIYGFLQLDRDTLTFVPIPGKNGEDGGSAYEQLCIAHWYGYDEEQRNENTVKTVSELLGNLPITGYYSMNMEDLPVLNHALGGVTVTIEDDMTSVDPRMKKGAQICLEDDEVEGYLRARMSVGDGTNIGRMRRQRQYMQSAYNIVMTNMGDDPDYINKIWEELTDVVNSDLPKKEMSRIAAAVNESENQGILTLEGESRIGTTLDDGEEHAEFYVYPSSITKELGKLISLTKE